MKKFLSSFITFWIIWSALAGFDPREMLVGAVVSLVLAVIVSRYLAFSYDLSIFRRVFLFIFKYIPVFLYRMVLANIDMAGRVLSPHIPLEPGFVRIKTAIKGKAGRLVLANSITLTPGTMSVDVDGDYLYIHWVAVKGKGPDDYAKEIAEPFEKILGGIFK